MIRIAILLFTLLGLVPQASAQTLAEIEKREAAVIEAWQKTPLTIRRAIYIAGAPKGFGEYEERSSSVFQPGEKLVVYAEPVGYGWKELGGGMYQFGFHADFTIYGADGKSIGEQKDFAYLEGESHARNREFMVVLTLSVTGAPAGDYVLEYRLRDLTGDKSTSFKLPIKIAG